MFPYEASGRIKKKSWRLFPCLSKYFHRIQSYSVHFACRIRNCMELFIFKVWIIWNLQSIVRDKYTQEIFFPSPVSFVKSVHTGILFAIVYSHKICALQVFIIPFVRIRDELASGNSRNVYLNVVSLVIKMQKTLSRSKYIWS